MALLVVVGMPETTSEFKGLVTRSKLVEKLTDGSKAPAAPIETSNT